MKEITAYQSDDGKFVGTYEEALKSELKSSKRSKTTLVRTNASKESLDLWMSDSLKKSVDRASVPTVLVGEWDNI